LQRLDAVGSDVIAVLDDVGSVALDEVMVGDLCGEEVAHVVRTDIETDQEFVPPMFVAVKDALSVKIKYLPGVTVKPWDWAREVRKEAGRDTRDDVFVVHETKVEAS